MNKLALYSFVGLIVSLILLVTFSLLNFLFGIGINTALFFWIFIICFVLFVIELIRIPKKRGYEVPNKTISNKFLTVVLTAYNDELSIQSSVEDFKNHPLVKRVIVVSNNSKDRTMELAAQAGAVTFNEEIQGYGACVHRALSEGIKHEDTDFTLLCEGDMTFRAHDIDKFLAYIPHADIVNGTRIVEQLRSGGTQLSSFMFYGNFFVGKLLELKHLSKGTFTDVGTTYKLCSNSSLQQLLPILDKKINLEFNPYFMDVALSNKIKLVECPITFYPRVGVSKGGNINNWVAFKLGLKMITGILFSWRSEKQ